MFHIKDNFSAGAPISQVPASWFNQVAGFINGLIGGYGINITKNGEGISRVEIDEDVVKCDKSVGTPSTIGSFPTEVTPKSFSWSAGGANGVNIHILAEGESNGGVHQLYDAVLHFSKDGMLVSVTNGTGGVDIMG